MKFWKLQLRKTNRGLVLGLIIIIAVTIYTLIDNQNFKKEKPEIKQLVTDYIEKLEEFGVTPAELKGKEISEQDTKEYIDRWNSFVDEYWIYKKRNLNSVYYGIMKSEFSQQYESFLIGKVNSFTEECTMEARNIKISKAGPDCATVSFDFYSVINGTNLMDALTPSFSEDVNWYGEGGDEENSVSKYKLEGEYTLSLERTSEGWKIYQTDGYITQVECLDKQTINKPDNEENSEIKEDISAGEADKKPENNQNTEDTDSSDNTADDSDAVTNEE